MTTQHTGNPESEQLQFQNAFGDYTKKCPVCQKLYINTWTSYHYTYYNHGTRGVCSRQVRR